MAPDLPPGMTVRLHTRRIRLEIEGTVQGVGFRPYVYRLAQSLGLSGFVKNDVHGVVVEVEGTPSALDQFVERLPVETPPLAVCEHVRRTEVGLRGEQHFTIAASDAGATDTTDTAPVTVTPDAATCPECLQELFDPANRRYRYPFINCTNCGPRFTIVRGVPYDRPLTTMASFTMCATCLTEYEQPADRRFHAQPNACPTCGPHVHFVDTTGRSRALGDAHDAVEAAADALRNGEILAIKGLGGYHLSCLASDQAAVDRLRRRKHREAKPFALMAADVTAARRLVDIDEAELALLTSRARPILLARRRAEADVAAAVAPGQRDLGVMLPYTPLHHLLLADVGAPLVMTSGNRSDEPIAFDDDDARRRLCALVDGFLVHERPIQTRADDSVVRVVTVGTERQQMTLRRSRGYVPSAFSLPCSVPSPMLACGGQQKNTFCLVRDRHAWVGPHIGDLENYETLWSYTNGIDHLQRLLAVEPTHVAHDVHPDYRSTAYALDRIERAGLDEGARTGVQHHHAHLAACLAEYGRTGPAVGVIFDGTGYGSDGSVWGGELLVGDLEGFERIAHLWPVRMPGGERAVREPWRMACSWLMHAMPDQVPTRPRTLCPHISASHWRAASQLARSGLASPMTSSMGRFFDAAAALCGVGSHVSYEGQAAIEFEMLVDPHESGQYTLPIVCTNPAAPMQWDGRVLIRQLVADIVAGVPIGQIAARVHRGVSYASAELCAVAAERRHIDTIVLSGGVFQNVVLLERTASLLLHRGFTVLVPRRLPVNDGGLSFGQAAIAAARVSKRANTAEPSERARSLFQPNQSLCV